MQAIFLKSLLFALARTLGLPLFERICLSRTHVTLGYRGGNVPHRLILSCGYFRCDHFILRLNNYLKGTGLTQPKQLMATNMAQHQCIAAGTEFHEYLPKIVLSCGKSHEKISIRQLFGESYWSWSFGIKALNSFVYLPQLLPILIEFYLNRLNELPWYFRNTCWCNPIQRFFLNFTSFDCTDHNDLSVVSDTKIARNPSVRVYQVNLEKR